MWLHIFRVLIKHLSRAGSAGVRVSRSGRIVVSGLIRNRPLSGLTHQEVRNALAKAGLREAHNAHFVKRLIERGPSMGINTLDDFVRMFNNGTATAGRDGTTIVKFAQGTGRAILNREGHLVSLVWP